MRTLHSDILHEDRAPELLPTIEMSREEIEERAARSARYFRGRWDTRRELDFTPPDERRRR
jgi:hypothetical protein